MLNNQQYIELFLSFIMFLFILGYFRNFMLDNQNTTYDIIITSCLFALWYFLTKLLIDFV